MQIVCIAVGFGGRACRPTNRLYRRGFRRQSLPALQTACVAVGFGGRARCPTTGHRDLCGQC
jgi:hypothetical protein